MRLVEYSQGMTLFDNHVEATEGFCLRVCQPEVSGSAEKKQLLCQNCKLSNEQHVVGFNLSY